MAKRHSWEKLLASLLLIWAVIDISIPSLCRSEGLSGFSTETVSIAAGSALGNSEQPAYAYEDDCFCCCSHIVPSPHFQLAAFLLSASADLKPSDGQAEGSAGSLYHPPRS